MSFPNDNAANIADAQQTTRTETIGIPVRFETTARGVGSQPSSAIAYGNRETYRSWPLNSDHVEKRAPPATISPNRPPPINREMSGQPLDSLQSAASVVTEIPANVGMK